ncbi:MAG TPA: glutamine-hydrolyzing GMP synthase [Spirochaetota bacterium]|nr:glutamine-hydrolyzing GMP synthase [Spirochaetota bacterium]
MKNILVLDFGGQYAHLIAKRFRNMGFYSEIALPSVDEKSIKNTCGIVLSGGPASVYENDIPEFNQKILDLDIPILGLCYGHQILAKSYGGNVEKAKVGEFGFASIEKINDSPLFKNIQFPNQVWMSHSDEVTKLPDNFEITAKTNDCPIAGFQNIKLKRFGLQFHSEVKDTVNGNTFLLNFAEFCNMEKNWDSRKVVEFIKKEIKETAKDKKVLLFLSGGVDSSVAFALLNETLGTERVLGLYINNGFMRKNETEQIKNRYYAAGYKNFIIEDASEKFLKAVENITDPQQKRKNIGETFLKIREEVVKRLNLDENDRLLGQGTLYPDIIESGGTKHSRAIKTHHNRVEGIQALIEKGLIIEPLKDLYKDEVRVIGKTLGLGDEMVFRHPFPGPGLSINLLCSDGILKDKDKLNETNELLSKANLKEFTSKSFKLYALPVKSVGVQGDFRTYSFPAVLNFDDIFSPEFNWDIFEKISSYVTNNVRNVNRTIVEIFAKKNLKLIKGYCVKERLEMIREVDALVLLKLKKSGWYDKIFQHLTISIPYAENNDSCSIVLRPVVSEDVMTARFARLPLDLLKEISEEIKKFDFVSALYYDITNKPPATFGWE